MNVDSDSIEPVQAAAPPPRLSFRWRTFLRGSAISIVATLLVGVFNYLIRRMLSIHLSDTDFGFFYSAMAVVLLALGLLDMGTNKALMILIAKAHAKGMKSEIQRIFSGGLFIRFAGSVAVYLGLVALSPFLLLHHFEYEVDAWVLPCLFSMIVILAAGGTFGTLFAALKCYGLSNLMSWSRPIVILAAGTALIPKFGLVGAVALFPAAGLLGAMVVMGVSLAHYDIRPRWAHIRDWSSLREILHFSKWIAIPVMGMTTMYQMDTICLTWFDSLEEVARYNIALPIMAIVHSLMIFPFVFTPIVTEMWHRGAVQEIGVVCRTMTYSLLALLGPIVGGGIVFGEKIISLLFDERFVTVKWAMVTLWIGMIFLTISNFLVNALSSGDHHKKLALPILVSVLANLTLNVFLIPRYGALGAAIATASSYAVLATHLLIVTRSIVGIGVDPMIWLNLLLGVGYLYGAYHFHGVQLGVVAKIVVYLASAGILSGILVMVSPMMRRELFMLAGTAFKRCKR